MNKKINLQIKKISVKVGNNKILIQNFSYLSALRIFSLLLPLVTYPYLIRVLGKETYGLVVFAQAIVGYLLIFVSFGFNISATKEVSVHRNNPDKLSEIVSSILILKGMLFIVAFIILYTLFYFIPQVKGKEPLFILTMWVCLYDVIFPIWYFQGIEQMKYITYITLVSRLIFLILIFILIHSAADYLMFPIINGIGAVIAGIISLYIVFYQRHIKFKTPSMENLKYYFKGSLPIFISNVSGQLYVNTNKVIVGAFLGMTDVAYYDLGQKLTSVLQIPQRILSQALFPKISKEKNLGFIKKVFKFSTLLNVALYFFIFLFAKPIVVLLGGHQMINAIPVVHILTLTVPIIGMSYIFGILLLIPFGYEKDFSRVIVFAGLIYLVQALFIWAFIGFSIINVSIITLTTEMFVTVFIFYFCKKHKLWS